MKNIKIGAFEVEVKASLEGNGKANNKDTIYFLNELSLVYQYAAELNKLQGYDGHAKDFKSKSDEIFQFLKKIGVYD